MVELTIKNPLTGKQIFARGKIANTLLEQHKNGLIRLSRADIKKIKESHYQPQKKGGGVDEVNYTYNAAIVIGLFKVVPLLVNRIRIFFINNRNKPIKIKQMVEDLPNELQEKIEFNNLMNDLPPDLQNNIYDELSKNSLQDRAKIVNIDTEFYKNYMKTYDTIVKDRKNKLTKILDFKPSMNTKSYDEMTVTERAFISNFFIANIYTKDNVKYDFTEMNFDVEEGLDYKYILRRDDYFIPIENILENLNTITIDNINKNETITDLFTEEMIKSPHYIKYVGYWFDVVLTDMKISIRKIINNSNASIENKNDNVKKIKTLYEKIKSVYKIHIDAYVLEWNHWFIAKLFMGGSKYIYDNGYLHDPRHLDLIDLSFMDIIKDEHRWKTHNDEVVDKNFWTKKMKLNQIIEFIQSIPFECKLTKMLHLGRGVADF
jgi:hypothetical protein